MVAGEAGAAFRLVIRVRGRCVVYDVPTPAGYKQALAHVARAVHRHAPEGRIERVELERRVPAGVAPVGDAPADAPSWAPIERWDAEVVARILSQPPPVLAPSRWLAAAPLVPAPPPGGPLVDAAAETGGNLAPPHTPAPQAGVPVCASTGREAPADLPALPAEHRRGTNGNGRNGHGQNGNQAPKAGAVAVAVVEIAPAGAGRSLAPGVAGERLPARVRPRPVNHRTTHRWHLVLAVVVIGVAWLGLAAVLAGGKMISLLSAHRNASSGVAEHLPFDSLRDAQAPERPAAGATSRPAAASRPEDPALAGPSPGPHQVMLSPEWAWNRAAPERWPGAPAPLLYETNPFRYSTYINPDDAAIRQFLFSGLPRWPDAGFAPTDR